MPTYREWSNRARQCSDRETLISRYRPFRCNRYYLNEDISDISSLFEKRCDFCAKKLKTEKIITFNNIKYKLCGNCQYLFKTMKNDFIVNKYNVINKILEILSPIPHFVIDSQEIDNSYATDIDDMLSHELLGRRW